MGGEHAAQAHAGARAKQTVTDLSGSRVCHHRPLGFSADAFKCTGDAFVVARILYRRRIGEIFALATDRSFDQVAEKHAGSTDNDQPQRQNSHTVTVTAASYRTAGTQ